MFQDKLTSHLVATVVRAVTTVQAWATRDHSTSATKVSIVWAAHPHRLLTTTASSTLLSRQLCMFYNFIPQLENENKNRNQVVIMS